MKLLVQWQDYGSHRQKGNGIQFSPPFIIANQMIKTQSTTYTLNPKHPDIFINGQQPSEKYFSHSPMWKVLLAPEESRLVLVLVADFRGPARKKSLNFTAAQTVANHSVGYKASNLSMLDFDVYEIAFYQCFSFLSRFAHHHMVSYSHND